MTRAPLDNLPGRLNLRRQILVLAFLFPVLVAGLWGTVSAAPPENFVNELLFDDLVTPISFAFLPDGRLLIPTKGGNIYITDPSAPSPTKNLYMSIANIESQAERGVLDITLDPDFANNGYFYLYYTPATPAHASIVRFTHQENAGGLTSTGDINSAFSLWQDTEGYESCCHWGGGLDFGPDGRLYLTFGDQFDGAVAQDLTRPGGSVIRINSDGSIPVDNPFADGPGGLHDAIWAYGLRNPFRSRWDLQSNRYFIGEVGGNSNISWEDLHAATLASAGTNFGWPLCEGACDNPDFSTTCDCTEHDDPIFTYPHGDSSASITGGVVYRGSQFPSDPYNGAYFYGDFAREWIRYLTFDGTGQVTGDFAFEPTAGAVIAIEQGPDGSLYYATVFGEVRRLTFNDGNQAPSIDAISVSPTQGVAPLAVGFEALASDLEDDAMSYLWVFGDGDSASGLVVNDTIPAMMHSYLSNGLYEAHLEVSDSAHTTRSADIPIAVGSPPSVSIDLPADQQLFRAGELVDFTASGNDPDGSVGPSDFTWTIRFRHNFHFHPVLSGYVGQSGQLEIPTSGHDYSSNTAYVLEVELTDSDGLTARDSLEILPDKVDLTFETDPPGITFFLDSNPRVTPFTYDTLKGFEHLIRVDSTTCYMDSSYIYQSWSDGGAREHVITVPETNQTYTAEFANQGGCVLPVTNGLVMRLRADEGVSQNGSEVVAWADLSSSGNSLISFGGDPQIVEGQLNGHDYVQLDGIDDALGRTGFSGLPTGSSDRSILLVTRYTSNGPSGFTYGRNQCNEAFGLGVTGGAGNLFTIGWCSENDFPTSEPGVGAGWISHSVVLSGDQIQHYKDGNLIGSEPHVFATQSISNLAVRLGVSLDDFVHVGMDVAELLVYDRALSENERQQIEQYFRDQYLGPLPPSISILQPTEGEIIEGDEVTVSWQAAGDTSNADHVHVSLDGNPPTMPPQLIGSKTFQGVAPGPHFAIVELATSAHTTIASDTVNFSVVPEGMCCAPVAVDDTTTTAVAGVTVVDVLANDSDPDGTLDPTSVTVTTPPMHGQVLFIDAPTGRIVYRHDGGGAVLDSLRYQVDDDSSETSNAALVRIEIEPAGCTLPSNGLALHLESDQGVVVSGSSVQQWSDLSGGGYTLTGVGDPQLITIGGPNGQSYVELDGSGDLLQEGPPLVGLPDSGSARSVFFVVRYQEAGAAGAIWGTDACGEAFGLTAGPTGTLSLTSGCSDLTSVEPSAGAGWLVHSAVLDGSALRHFKNGVQIDSLGLVVNTVLDRLVLGATLDGQTFAAVDVAALLIYDRPLPDVERLVVENVLQEKYLGVPCVPGVQPPIAVDDLSVLPPGTFVGIPVLANDFDPIGTFISSSILIIDAPHHGIAVVDTTTGWISYNHSGDLSVADSLQYIVRSDSGRWSNVADVRVVISEVVAIEDPAVPKRFALYQNQPNPTTGRTSIRFELARATRVRLAIYDLRGRLVRSGLDEIDLAAGSHQWIWDARDDAGRRVRPGVYFYRLHSPVFTETRKLILGD